MARAKLRRDTQTEDAPVALPQPLSVLDIGRQIVKLSNRHDEMDQEVLDLNRQGLGEGEVYTQTRELRRRMSLLFEREEALVDIALGMRADSLGDVAVMLRLACRQADAEAACEYDPARLEKALRQIKHALYTSINVVIRAAGLDMAETVGSDTQAFIDREHADLGDGL
jgi:hypothetical protein